MFLPKRVALRGSAWTLCGANPASRSGRESQNEAQLRTQSCQASLGSGCRRRRVQRRSAGKLGVWRSDGARRKRVHTWAQNSTRRLSTLGVLVASTSPTSSRVLRFWRLVAEGRETLGLALVSRPMGGTRGRAPHGSAAIQADRPPGERRRLCHADRGGTRTRQRVSIVKDPDSRVV